MFNTKPGSGIIGDCYNVKRAVHAATLFDPLHAYDETTAHKLIDQLSHFGYPEFDETFITGMKHEWRQMQLETEKPYDWDSYPEVAAYNLKLASRKERAQAAEEKGAEADPVPRPTPTKRLVVRFGTKGGDKMVFDAGGVQYQVTIPEGLLPGQEFDVPLPEVPAQAPAAAVRRSSTADSTSESEAEEEEEPLQQAGGRYRRCY